MPIGRIETEGDLLRWLRQAIEGQPGLIQSRHVQGLDLTGGGGGGEDNLFIGPDAPVSPPGTYLWIETDAGGPGGMTFWVEDGA
jgi:hypothetical protein